MISQLITSEQISLNQNPIYLSFKGIACMGSALHGALQGTTCIFAHYNKSVRDRKAPVMY